MNNGVKVLYKSLLTYVIDFVIFLIGLISIAYFDEYLKSINLHQFQFIKYVFFAFFIIYLLFSNTFFRGLSALLLKYTFSSEKKRILKIILANTIFYSAFCGFIWFSINHTSKIFVYCSQIVLLIEFGSCFIPMINTRLTFYLLKITMVFYTKKERILENNGILL